MLSLSNTNDSAGAAGIRIGVVRGLVVPVLVLFSSRSLLRFDGYRCIADLASSGISRRESWFSNVDEDVGSEGFRILD